MARPLKTGVDYFPLDTDFFTDKKIKLLKGEFGARGLLIVLFTLCQVYSTNGYYMSFDNDDAILAADELNCGITPELVREVVQGSVKRSLFDEGVFNQFGVLTSPGIQRRFIRAISKRDDIAVFEEYWLLDIDDPNDVPQAMRNKVTFKSVSGEKTIVSGGKNPVNSSENPLKESRKKVKESKKKVVVDTTPARPDFNTVESYASSNLDYLSPSNMQDLIAFRETLPDDLIRYAIDAACANGVRKWAYVRSILARYQSAGYKTVGEVKNAEEQRTRQKSNGYNPALNYDESAHYKKDQSGRYFDVLKHYGAKPNPALNYTQRSNEETNYSGTFINLLEEYGGNE